MERFNLSLDVDKVMWEADLDGSVAYSRALEKAKVITPAEGQSIRSGLEKVRAEWAAGTFEPKEGDEDIHTANERRLTELVGSVGGKVHTGRSRNDQVVTDLRLHLRGLCARLLELVHSLVLVAAKRARAEADILMPGYTHLQSAQPIRWSHWILAHASSWRRDGERLAQIAERLNEMPLGSGALAGNPFGIDREALAADLGFARPIANSIDGVTDRDFVIELTMWVSLLMVHLSKFGEDLIIYGTQEFGFVKFADAYSTGSSLMPQKKNPDALELVRGKCGMQVGRLVGVMTTMKALPLAYNKDMQEDKVPLFDAMDELSICLRVLPPLLEGIVVRRVEARAAAIGDFANATELADHLVARGVPFRDAHHQVGRLVAEAIERGLPLEDLSIAEIRNHAPAADETVFVDLTVDAAIAKRNAVGGTAFDQITTRLARLKKPDARERPLGEIDVRKATVADLAEIKRLVDLWADAGENLPRSEEEILQSIGEFAVATEDDRVVGCGALWLYTPTLAEIRSVGVDPSCHGGGVGSRLIEHLAKIAEDLRIERVFVLTRVPRFFERLKFRTVSVNGLPEKILKDCARCPKKHDCDEIAMVRTTWPEAS